MDFKESFKWYQKAGDQGLSGAQFQLGYMYAKGKGVLRDDVAAYAWWKISEANGLAVAKKNLDILKRRMSPFQIAKTQKLSKEMIKKNPKLLNK